MNIKVRLINPACRLNIIDKGDWIDLKAAVTMRMNAPTSTKQGKVNIVNFDYDYIPLGIAMKLPRGFEAVINPRSSTFKNFRIMSWNSQGVIDNSYCGNGDQWCFPAIAFNNTLITEGDRIAQFRIQLSQKATFLQKLRWLFVRQIKFIYVDNLENSDRGGFGSTGIK